VLAPEALPGEERATWARLGIRSAVVVPLIGRDGGWLGLITMAYPSARGLGGGAAGGYLAIGAQAALALENLQLVEQGRQIGALAERQRLAREIHDSVKQQVFATGMQIGAALALIERDPVAAKARLAEADALVRQAQDELAAVIHELRPATLDGRGLAVTLREYAARWSRQSDIAAEVRVAEGCAIPLETEQALFRVAQEALANVARHSGAATAMIELACDDGEATLRVTDDGRGFVAGALDGRGYGLASMGERVAALGGRVTVESAPGEGTRVTCTCPLGG
jgi:NarL family two-component system sensor histidine kinase LiaS